MQACKHKVSEMQSHNTLFPSFSGRPISVSCVLFQSTMTMSIILLTVIDVFLRYAYTLPIRTKDGDHFTDSFAELFKKETPQFLQRDKGTEFINKKTQALLKTHSVKWFTTENLSKAQIVE